MTFRSLSNETIHSTEGFGLIGVIFLILFLSITSVSIYTVLTSAQSSKQIRQTADTAALLRNGIRTYSLSHGGSAGALPLSLNGLVTTDGVISDGTVNCHTDNNPAHVATYLSLQGWCGPYINQVFQENPNEFKTDGWMSLFQYNSATGVITSCGPDRTCGNGDDLTY